MSLFAATWRCVHVCSFDFIPLCFPRQLSRRYSSLLSVLLLLHLQTLLVPPLPLLGIIFTKTIVSLFRSPPASSIFAFVYVVRANTQAR